MSALEAKPPQADLAVVVVNYNAGEYLTRCVTSVVDASGGLAVDLLVVDNASRDASARMAAERTPQVRLIDNPTNRGLSAAWNQGARTIDAPWILFLNADAEILQGDLGAFMKAGEGRPDVALLGPMIRNPDRTIYESGRAFRASHRPSGTRSSGRSRPATASRARTGRRAGTEPPSARSTG
jgi:GT2 family glycosyltransferase